MLGSNNPFPSVLLEEQGSAPASPATGAHRLFIDGSGVLKLVDHSGTVTPVDATDTDLVVQVLQDKLTAAGAETHVNLGEPPVSGSVQIWKNGTHLWPTDDWTISGSTVTLLAALTAGQVIRTYYLTTATGTAASTLS